MNIHSLLSLLTDSLSPNNQLLKNASSSLLELSCRQGYIPSLFQIAIDPHQPLNIISAALAQVNNTLRDNRAHYNIGSFDRISHQDYQFVCRYVLQINMTLAHIPALGRLLRDIVEIVGKNCLESVGGVCEMLMIGDQPKACLNYLMGIVKSFGNCFQTEQIQLFSQTRLRISQTLLSLIHSGQIGLVMLHQQLTQQSPSQDREAFIAQRQLFEQVLYLSIKLMQKSAKVREYGCDFMRMAGRWAVICLNRIIEEVPVTKKMVEWEDLGGQFCHFHGKKWASKFLTHFFQRILKYRQQQIQQRIICEQFLFQNSQIIQKCILISLTQSHPRKIQYHNLKILQQLIKYHSKLLANYKQFKSKMLKQILPMFMIVREKDISFAVQYPKQYIYNQDQGHMQEDYQNVRLLAVTLWKMLAAGKNYQLCEEKVQASPLMVKCLRMVGGWIAQQNSKHRIVGLYILSKLQTIIKKSTNLLGTVTEILKSIFPKILYQNSIETQIRVLDLVNLYGSCIELQSLEVIRIMVLQKLCRQNATDGHYPTLLVIKSAIIFHRCTFSSKLPEHRQLNALNLKQTLQTYINLIKEYQLPLLSQSFQNYFTYYQRQLQPYSQQIIQAMINLIRTCLQKQSEQNNSSISAVYQIGAGAITVLTLLSAMPMKEKIQQMMQITIKHLLDSSLIQSTMNEDALFFQDVIALLIKYMVGRRNTGVLSKQLMFYYQIIMYKVVGLHECALKDIYRLYSGEETSVLECCNYADNINYQMFYHVIRHYLYFVNFEQLQIRLFQEIYQDVLSANALQLVVYVVGSFYIMSGQRLGFADVALGRVFSCNLIMAVIQHFGERLHSSFLQFVLDIIYLNITVKCYQHQNLGNLNLQLFCLWLWASQQKALTMLQNSGKDKQYMIATILGFNTPIFKIISVIDHFQQRRRVILGLTTLINLSKYAPVIKSHLFFYFNWCVYLCLLNLEQPVNEQQLMMPDYSCDKFMQQFNDEMRIKRRELEQQPQIESLCIDQNDDVDYISPLDQLQQIQVFLDSLIELKSDRDLYLFLVDHSEQRQYLPMLISQVDRQNKKYRELLLHDELVMMNAGQSKQQQNYDDYLYD